MPRRRRPSSFSFFAERARQGIPCAVALSRRHEHGKRPGLDSDIERPSPDDLAVHLSRWSLVELHAQRAGTAKLHLPESRVPSALRQREDERRARHTDGRMGDADVEQPVVDARIGTDLEAAAIRGADLHGERDGLPARRLAAVERRRVAPRVEVVEQLVDAGLRIGTAPVRPVRLRRSTVSSAMAASRPNESVSTNQWPFTRPRSTACGSAASSCSHASSTLRDMPSVRA